MDDPDVFSKTCDAARAALATGDCEAAFVVWVGRDRMESAAYGNLLLISGGLQYGIHRVMQRITADDKVD